MNMNMEDKIHLAALRTKDVMTLEKGYNPEYVQASQLFGSENLFVKLRNEYLTEFCLQLNKVGIFNHELKGIHSMFKPDMCIKEYGFIQIIFKWCGSDEGDRNVCECYAKTTCRPCALINFNQDSVPSIQIFRPYHPSYFL
ncbi:UNVERIFIED_CONTAM: hypothetical protein RMT77_018961 [Armadillidium vulgare]